MQQLKYLDNTLTHWAMGSEAEVLSDIYNDDITIAIWQRNLAESINAYVQALLQSQQVIALKLVATLPQFQQELAKLFPPALSINGLLFTHDDFLRDLNQLLDMFSCLFDATTIGVRINTLDRSMCPRFHVDHVPVRLVTTYGGAGTQWLPSAFAERSQLGPNPRGANNPESSIVRNAQAIEQLKSGDVALLKGENWAGNEGRGLIHRSPSCHEIDGTVHRRLLITCDLV